MAAERKSERKEVEEETQIKNYRKCEEERFFLAFFTNRNDCCQIRILKLKLILYVLVVCISQVTNFLIAVKNCTLSAPFN